jgi:hypothetical protein
MWELLPSFRRKPESRIQVFDIKAIRQINKKTRELSYTEEIGVGLLFLYRLYNDC